MLTKVNQQVSVITIYDKDAGTVHPYSIKWSGKTYKIKNFGHDHPIRMGRNICHIFSVSTDSLAFRLRFDSETMHWTLEEVSDGY